MTKQVKIYHNPRCSKSRETLNLLKENGVEPEVVLYLETPADAATLRDLLKMLGMNSARELMRQKEDLLVPVRSYAGQAEQPGWVKTCPIRNIQEV